MPDGSNRRLVLFVVSISSLALVSCRSEFPDSPGSQSVAQSSVAPLFTEITAEAGLGSPPGHPPDGRFFVPEVMGPGVALFDADGDGDLDILQSRFPPPGRLEAPAPNRLYLRQPDGAFVDSTTPSGLGDPGYGQALAVGDVDDDGDLDVYVANFGPDALYLNQGGGRFAKADGAPFGGDDWSSSATFCDYDRDGDLDLYVVHYLRYRYQERCALGGTGEDYCSPTSFDGDFDALYRNDGSGVFRDVSTEAGILVTAGRRAGRGLGVVCLDLTRDGRLDFFVGNDGEVNHLWVNRGNGSFTDEAIMRGVAVNRQGSPEASMGITIGDVDRDGFLDLFLTHLAQETNTLYLGSDGMLFRDRSIESGLSRHDLALTGFGCGFLDFDNDGDLDLAVVNGRIHRGPALPGADLGEFWNRYAEPNLLFENDGTGRFSDVGERAGLFASRVELSRGLAFGDIDDDGDEDLVISSGHDGLHLYQNDAPPPGNHWLRVRALSGNRNAPGSVVTLISGERRYVGAVLTTYSYQSSSDPRLHFGLGTIERIDSIEVIWPDGLQERFAATSVDTDVTLRKGSGL